MLSSTLIAAYILQTKHVNGEDGTVEEKRPLLRRHRNDKSATNDDDYTFKSKMKTLSTSTG